MNKIISVALITFLVGCAGNRPRESFPAHLDISYTSKSSMAIGVHDRRPYVVDHDKYDNFAGIIRGAYGIPISMPTTSGNPLANDMAKAIGDSIGTPVNIKIVNLSPFSEKQEAINTLKSSGVKNILLLTVNQWKFDTYINPTVFYDLEMEVIDNNGIVLLSKKDSGSDDSEGGVFTAYEDAVAFSQKTFKRKVESLYNGEISTELSGH